MKKLLLILCVLIVWVNSIGQDVVGSRIIAKQSLFVKDNWVDSLRRDTINWANDFRTLPTTGAVYKFVAGRMGGGGGSNTDSLFGKQDNIAEENRIFNLSTNFLSLQSNSGTNYFEIGGSTTSPYFESYTQGAVSNSTISQGPSDISLYTQSNRNFYFTLTANANFNKADLASERVVDGTWVDTKYETLNTGNPATSSIHTHLEIWEGTPGTASEIRQDIDGIQLRTSQLVGAPPSDYKGLQILPTQDIRFQNYPSSRSDGTTPKALYITNSNGDVGYGEISKVDSVVLENDTLKYYIGSTPTTITPVVPYDFTGLTSGDMLRWNGTDFINVNYETLTKTFTNTRWTARVGSTTSSATPTINTDNVDVYKLTAQTVDITSFTTNLSGSPQDADILEIQVTGTASRAITWGASFVSSTVTLPTTTDGTATLTVILQYYTTSSYGNNKWVCTNYY